MSGNKLQCELRGVGYVSIDVSNENWLSQVRTECETGEIAGILYSNPNNPTGQVYGDQILSQLAQICIENDVVAIEDLAYLLMNYSEDQTIPGEEPFAPTITKFMKDEGQYILLFSLSKLFSYAGEGVGVAKVSKSLAERSIDDLGLPIAQAAGAHNFGELFPIGVYAATARGASHSAQIAAAETFRLASSGELRDYIIEVKREYGMRIQRAVEMFERSGFELAYEIPRSEQGMGAAMYFTVEHPHYQHGGELLKDLLCFGIGVSPVAPCGGKKNSLRFSISDVDSNALDLLDRRLGNFAQFRRAAAELGGGEDTYACRMN
ncbi:MAG: aminotransferase class I/II-fold pyridoxal phosphate-dependent enzyme [Candidatus Woesearchaeota archaeon]